MTRKAFTLIELLVVISIIALLISVMMPFLRKAREAAKEVVCGANMHQWGAIFQMYTQDNDGFFHTGWMKSGGGHLLWPNAMRPYYNNPDIRVCPKANDPRKASTMGFWGPIPYIQEYSWTHDLAGDYGSYGVNGYVRNMDTKLSGMEGQGVENLWRRTTQTGKFSRNRIPVFSDAWWLVGTPNDNNRPPAYPGERVSNPNESMMRFCLDRHNGYVQTLFMDWSARKVGLKELWTLKWHRSFNTANSYTLAGNGGDLAATAALWDSLAPWMSRYEEY